MANCIYLIVSSLSSGLCLRSPCLHTSTQATEVQATTISHSARSSFIFVTGGDPKTIFFLSQSNITRHELSWTACNAGNTGGRGVRPTSLTFALVAPRQGARTLCVAMLFISGIYTRDRENCS